MDDTPLDEETVAKLKQVIDEHTQLCEAEYDGVLGTLPEWVPDSNQKEFQDSRNQLLEHYSHSQILHWIESYISHRLTGELPECSYGQKFIMPDARYNISVLALIKKAVLSGKKKGLGLLAGNLAVKGDSFSQAGGTKKGKYYEPKKSIKIICNGIKSYDFNKVLEVLEHNAENDEDEKFDDLLSLIDVIFGDVDHEEKRIHFYKRGVNPNTENKKNIGFAHLINILSGLRKEK